MKILVVNAGSSSLKYQLFDMDTGAVLAKGICEKIGLSGCVTHKRPGKDPYREDVSLPSHDEAMALVLRLLSDRELGVISSAEEISAVGHRFAHGGKFRSSRILGDEELAYLESIIPINPLHGPPAIKGVVACKKQMPGKPQVGVFDTSFYADMPEESYLYALPYEWYEKYGIRKYGFHGTSHRYVSAKAAEWMGKPLSELKIITCHIGSGSSITAVDRGVAIDTSMGFTPQDGLPMGTRCGAIDPSIIIYMMKQYGMSPDEVEEAMNKRSGLAGVSGVSSDAREIWNAIDAGNKRARLAIDLLVHQAKKIIGGYIAEMNGIDCLVFTAGLGENDNGVRHGIATGMEVFGIRINEQRNWAARRGETFELSAKDSRVRVFVIPTDEEYMIAKDTVDLLS